jgi:hypothetical protein
MIMTWWSTISDARTFCSKASNDPDTVFVSGFSQGRRCDLTLSTAIELFSKINVFGPQKKWLVSVECHGQRLRLLIVKTHSDARPAKKKRARCTLSY